MEGFADLFACLVNKLNEKGTYIAAALTLYIR